LEKEVCTFTYSKRLAENNSEPPPDFRLMIGQIGLPGIDSVVFSSSSFKSSSLPSHLVVNVIIGVRNGKQLVDEPVADAATFPLLASQT